MAPTIGGGQKVLILEDDTGMADLLAILLQKEGFVTETVGDGKKGLDRVVSYEPAIILTDLMMPGLGGYEFLRELQAQGLGKIPVIVISARSMDPRMLGTIKNEPNVIDFIPKPVKPFLLSGALAKALKRIS